MNGDRPLWAATEADDHGWGSNPRQFMAVEKPDSYIINQAWLWRGRNIATNKASSVSYVLPKSGFISELNLATGKRYTFYKECFWSRSSRTISSIPVYIFSLEKHAFAFIADAEERFASRESDQESPPQLAADVPYQVLGVGREATRGQIKQAFREQARRLHPDAGGDPGEFKTLVEAYNLLIAR